MKTYRLRRVTVKTKETVTVRGDATAGHHVCPVCGSRSGPVESFAKPPPLQLPAPDGNKPGSGMQTTTKHDQHLLEHRTNVQEKKENE